MSKCPNCGFETDGKFCPECGSFVPQPVSELAAKPTPTYAAPVIVNNAAPETIPEKYRPLSPWAYVGYSLLFSIPIVGFIMLIVYSFNDSNINRRNYARSIWCGLLISLILTIILFIILYAAGYNFNNLLQNGRGYYGW